VSNALLQSHAADPSGLNGERIARDEKFAPDVVELWCYPASVTFDVIEAAWRAAPRRERTLVGTITIYKQSAGQLFVSVRLFVWPAPAPLHIDEPPI
jgi:hypothetical protein